jgi:hypothetical protein
MKCSYIFYMLLYFHLCHASGSSLAGQLHLGREDLKEIGIVPSGLQTLGLDANLQCAILSQEVECQAPKHTEVVCAIAFAQPALILTEGDIEDPV